MYQKQVDNELHRFDQNYKPYQKFLAKINGNELRHLGLYVSGNQKNEYKLQNN